MQDLSSTKQFAFALLITERMMPSLPVFSKETGFDHSCYVQGLQTAWLALLSHTVDPGLVARCSASAPDTEIYSHKLTSYALNAALAISELLEFVVDENADHVAFIQTLAHDSIYLYLNGLALSDDEIGAHPLSQIELRRQREDEKFISTLPDSFGTETVAALKARGEAQEPLFPR